jgi:hypothetical protein
MARPCVVEGGTASKMKGRLEYIELADLHSWQVMVLQLWVWVRCKQHLAQKTLFYKIKTGASDLD